MNTLKLKTSAEIREMMAEMSASPSPMQSRIAVEAFAKYCTDAILPVTEALEQAQAEVVKVNGFRESLAAKHRATTDLLTATQADFAANRNAIAKLLGMTEPVSWNQIGHALTTVVEERDALKQQLTSSQQRVKELEQAVELMRKVFASGAVHCELLVTPTQPGKEGV